MEQARIEWFAEVGAEPDPSGESPVIINARCYFLKQLKYPGEIEIRTFVGAPGRSSFEMYHEIRHLYQQEVLGAEGGAKVVWGDCPLEKSVPILDRIRAMLMRREWG